MSKKDTNGKKIQFEQFCIYDLYTSVLNPPLSCLICSQKYTQVVNNKIIKKLINNQQLMR